jgi:hemerythrin-like domain-containing protein
MEDFLIVLNGSNTENAVEQAFKAAQSDSRKLKVLQVLDSGLYHYAHNDLVATRLNKRTFLLYIRDQVLEQGEIEANELRKRAHGMGISLEIESVETDDVISTVIAEAKKGYEKIFLPKEEKKLFPIFKKTVEQHLRREVSSMIISC